MPPVSSRQSEWARLREDINATRKIAKQARSNNDHVRLVVLYSDAIDLLDSFRSNECCLEGDRWRSKLFLKRAIAYRDLGQLWEAVQDASSALQQPKKPQLGFLLKASCLNELKLYADAAETLRTGLTIHPSDPQLLATFEYTLKQIRLGRHQYNIEGHQQRDSDCGSIIKPMKNAASYFFDISDILRSERNATSDSSGELSNLLEFIYESQDYFFGGFGAFLKLTDSASSLGSWGQMSEPQFWAFAKYTQIVCEFFGEDPFHAVWDTLTQDSATSISYPKFIEGIIRLLLARFQPKRSFAMAPSVAQQCIYLLGERVFPLLEEWELREKPRKYINNLNLETVHSKQVISVTKAKSKTIQSVFVAAKSGDLMDLEDLIRLLCSSTGVIDCNDKREFGVFIHTLIMVTKAIVPDDIKITPMKFSEILYWVCDLSITAGVVPFEDRFSMLLKRLLSSFN